MALKKEDDYPPVIAQKFLGPHQVAGPIEPLADQIERRNGIKAEEIDTIIMRQVSRSSL